MERVLPDARCGLASEFLDLGGESFGFGFQFRQFGFERGDSFCRHGVEQAGLFLHQLRQFILGAFAQAVRGFEHSDDLHFETLPQSPQLCDLLVVAEVEISPAFSENESVRVVGDLAQCGEVARVPRMIDRAGQLFIRFELLRVIGETVGMIELHELAPERTHFVGFSLGKLSLVLHRRCGFLVFPLCLCLRLLKLFAHLLCVLLEFFAFVCQYSNMPRKKAREKKPGMPIPLLGEIDAFAMIVDMNGFTAMVREARRQDSIAQFVRDCLSLAIGFVEEEGGEVVSFMGDAFLGVLPDAKSAILASFAIAHGLDEQCEWITNIQQESQDAWACAPGGPSIKIAIEFGRLDVSTIYSRLLGEQRLLIGDAINYAARISKAPLQGNRCLVGPNAAKTEFSEYGLTGPHRLSADSKPGEPNYEYYIFKMSDVWIEGARKAGDTTYWG